jgi:hypothetical protein
MDSADSTRSGVIDDIRNQCARLGGAKSIPSYGRLTAQFAVARSGVARPDGEQ